MSEWEDIFDQWVEDDKSSKNKQIHIHDNTINVYFYEIPTNKIEKDIEKIETKKESPKINLQKLRNNPLMKKWKNILVQVFIENLY